MKRERETIKSEIGNFTILMKYCIAKRRRRYFISWDTSKTEKTIYIYFFFYINEDWERDKQIWDWQFHDINEILYRQKKKTIIHIMRYIQNRKNDIYIYEDCERDNQIRDWQFEDINEILYRQKKKTIFHIMRYIQNSKKDLYIYIWKWRLKERHNQIWDWQFHDIKEILYRQKKKRRRYCISRDTFKSTKMIYIYNNEDWARHNQIWDWQFQDINKILYRQKKKTIFHIVRYIQNIKNDLYIYIW